MTRLPPYSPPPSPLVADGQHDSVDRDVFLSNAGGNDRRGLWRISQRDNEIAARQLTEILLFSRQSTRANPFVCFAPSVSEEPLRLLLLPAAEYLGL